MEEIFQEKDDMPPIIIQLAVGCSDEDGLLKAVVSRVRREVLVQLYERIIFSGSGIIRTTLTALYCLI